MSYCPSVDGGGDQPDMAGHTSALEPYYTYFSYLAYLALCFALFYAVKFIRDGANDDEHYEEDASDHQDDNNTSDLLDDDDIAEESDAEKKLHENAKRGPKPGQTQAEFVAEQIRLMNIKFGGCIVGTPINGPNDIEVHIMKVRRNANKMYEQ